MANTRKNLLARIVTPGGDNPLLLHLVAPAYIPNGTPVSGIALVGRGGAGGYAYSMLTGSAYGDLPPGLTLNPDGTITGTPAGIGTYIFVAQVQDSASAVYTASFSIRIASRLLVDKPLPPIGEVLVVYNGRFRVVNNTGALSFALISGNLPAGLSMDSAGVITGAPAADSNGLGGISYFTVRATDAGSGDWLDIPHKIRIFEALDFEPFDIPDIIRGQSYSYTFPTRGGVPPFTFTLIGNPFTTSKMNFNVRTGELSGVTKIAPDYYSVGLRVTDTLGATVTLFDVLTVKDANSVIQPQSGGVAVGDPDPAIFNFDSGENIDVEVTNVGGTLTVKPSIKKPSLVAFPLVDSAGTQLNGARLRLVWPDDAP